MAEALVSSFWGPVTSTIELCEENYAHSSYIAEFFNTVSNIPCILLALGGLINALRQRFEKRFSILHISNMILAIGSIVFHATLQHVVQQSDETPMFWEMLLYLYVVYSPDWHYRSTMPTFLFLYAAGFAVAHSLLRVNAVFMAQYFLVFLLCVPRMYKYYIHCKDAGAKRTVKLCVVSLCLGSLCWFIDRTFCAKLSGWYVNPQGHALWHLFMGFSSYLANTFLEFCRAQQLELSPRIRHAFGLFPYVKIKNPKAQ
ncbi:hypothetical protein KSP39_PZI002851 [Platanthera zijinensis]|uniref:Alkaline ceramidase n=1 Tax=Platanthera zijinensis TaxID=2320716 RepID=A0AAP0BX96_9ASPA